MERNSRLTIILAVGSLIGPIGLAGAQEKPNTQAEPASGARPGQPPGPPASGAASARTPAATTTIVPQVSPLPNGIQITNTQTVNNPRDTSSAPSPAAPPVIINGAAPVSAPVPTAGGGASATPAANAPESRVAPLTDSRGRPIETVRFERRVRTGLVAAGTTLFGVSYGLTVVAAAAIGTNCDRGNSDLGCTTERWPLFIPVAGPFIQMGYLEGGNDSSARALLALDGVLQAGGITMALIGLIIPKKIAIPVLTASRIRVTPYSGVNGSGLVAVGRF